MKKITAIAHPNFALIKYWGKSNFYENIPAMGSISVVVDAMKSETTVSFPPELKKDTWVLNKVEQPSLGHLEPSLQYLRSMSPMRQSCLIESTNNFPTAAGLASSASGTASFVKAMSQCLEIQPKRKQMIKATMLGSGSAPRSLFSGFVHLDFFEGALDCMTILNPEEWPLKVIVCLTSLERKSVSSRDGMEISRKTSSFYKDWVNNHYQDIELALSAIASRNLKTLGTVAQENCLKMHEVMKTSQPSIDYWNMTTHSVVKSIETMQDDGLDIFYTIDAGPQVKIICKSDLTEEVCSAMKKISGIKSIIECGLGQGARLIGG